MGIDYCHYIGPYVRATETVEQKQVDRCSTHSFPDGSDFCPKCGTALGGRYQTVEVGNAPEGWKEKYEKYGRLATFHDYLYSTSVISKPGVVKKGGKMSRTFIYLPNRFTDTLGIPELGGAEEEWAMDNLDIPKVLATFKKLFSDEIAYLEQWFEVEVKYGYVSYYS